MCPINSGGWKESHGLAKIWGWKCFPPLINHTAIVPCENLMNIHTVAENPSEANKSISITLYLPPMLRLQIKSFNLYIKVVIFRFVIPLYPAYFA